MPERQPRPTELPLNDLAAAYIQAGETLFLALHDDVSARVRLVHPEAEYLEVSLGELGEFELYGIWSGSESDGDNCRLLYAPDHGTTEELLDSDGALAMDDIVRDLNRVLSHTFLHRWGVVQPHPRYEYRNHRRWIALTSSDRVAAIAGIVRGHLPDAESLICRFEYDSYGIAVGFEQVALTNGETVDIPCPRCTPDAEGSLWPHDVTHKLAHLLGQLYALPHLRSRHLMPCVDTRSDHEEQMWQLVLPYAATGTGSVDTPSHP
ncbi:hypothetical protein OK074_2083 [Actinobacteria bacterium OK074]|nr:hypothetical protein OK074_2083 [Actinobacteria bacterium OK074]